MQIVPKSLPSLYSLNSNGSIQKWNISVEGNKIIKHYGQVGGKIQEVEDVVHKGKNIGRANETSPEEQALAEATSQWEKKLKSGYTKTLKESKEGKTDAEFVTGGIEPMLAHKWRDHASKIVFPAFVQPKLDGIRCIAMIRKGKCTLWSRTRKPIKSMPHIVAELERQFNGQNDVVLDGELYNHSYKDKFEEIVSLVRPDAPKAGHAVVQYHIYDMTAQLWTFKQRSDYLSERIKANNILVLVKTIKVEEDEVTDYFTDFRKAGYEGAMIRNAKSLYECKRSYGLQKIKEFDDAEFKIIGVEAGRGRMAECAIFCCTTKLGDTFMCKMEGSLDALKVYLTKPKSVIGKKLTVRYQGLTNGNVPRFPIGVVVRDYE